MMSPSWTLGGRGRVPPWIRQCNRLELTKPTKPLAVSQNLLICVGDDTQWWIIFHSHIFQSEFPTLKRRFGISECKTPTAAFQRITLAG